MKYPESAPLRILAVDDEQTILNSYQRIFGKAQEIGGASPRIAGRKVSVSPSSAAFDIIIGRDSKNLNKID